MLIDDFGYILSEAPFFILIIWSAVKFVLWRRSRENRPAFSDKDRRMLFHAAPYSPAHWQFYPRFAFAVIAVTMLGWLQIIALAPLGAAIVSGALVLTSTAIVHGVMLGDR